MDTTRLPPDFKEFLRSLKVHKVRYLLIGGYAVGYHGFPRATMDIDVWVEPTDRNAERVTSALRAFGFGSDKLTKDLFLEPGIIARMGLPPMRIEILTSISGVEFGEAYEERISGVLDGIPVDVISLHHLKANKAAAGRARDLADLEELP